MRTTAGASDILSSSVRPFYLTQNGKYTVSNISKDLDLAEQVTMKSMIEEYSKMNNLNGANFVLTTNNFPSFISFLFEKRIAALPTWIRTYDNKKLDDKALDETKVAYSAERDEFVKLFGRYQEKRPDDNALYLEMVNNLIRTPIRSESPEAYGRIMVALHNVVTMKYAKQNFVDKAINTYDATTRPFLAAFEFPRGNENAAVITVRYE
jgi:hypothetical protein